MFVFSKREIDTSREIAVNGKTENVEQLLTQAFSNTNVKYEIQDNYIVLSKREVAPSPMQSAQKKEITGKVLDELGEPIIGASVVIEGTTTGTVTDLDGVFSISAPANATLTISYIGYKSVKVSAQTSPLVIKMKEDTKNLDEVVVVGFGSQKKVNLTGAVSTATAEVFESRPVQNAAMALQGVMPGLNISKTDGIMDKAPSMNVRGMTTIGDGSSGDPLILIDGMQGDINMLNPQDIESVSLLKDAAASSIYGSRAPFGVILVTTKKGKAGKFTVNYNDSFRWNTPVKRPNTVDSYRFATYFNDAAINAKGTGKFTPERMQRIKDYMDGKITTKNIPE